MRDEVTIFAFFDNDFYIHVTLHRPGILHEEIRGIFN